jgi:dihydrodipicolinate reductase
MKKKARTARVFPLSHADAVRFGKMGGNRLLISQGKGERITIKHRNGKIETIN